MTGIYSKMTANQTAREVVDVLASRLGHSEKETCFEIGRMLNVGGQYFYDIYTGDAMAMENVHNSIRWLKGLIEHVPAA